MRIEVLPRIWIADRKHSKCYIENQELIHTLRLEDRCMQDVIREFDRITHRIYSLSVSALNPVILIDCNIHTTYMTYAIIVAYIIRFTSVSLQKAIIQLKTKTLPFHFSSVHMQCLQKFASRFP